MVKSVIEALREAAAAEVLIIEPGVSAEQALASLERAYQEGLPLDGCSVNRGRVDAGELGERPGFVWGQAMSLSLRYLQQLVRETGLGEGSLAERSAADFDLAGVIEREHARAAEADAHASQLLEADLEPLGGVEYIPW